MEGLWILAIIWAALSLFGKLSQQKRGETGRQRLPGKEPQGRVGRPDRATGARERARSEPVEGGAAEDEWRREIERLLGVRTGADYGPVGRRSREGLPEAEDVEERGSLETEPEAVSLETLEDRLPGPVADFDDEAQAVVAQRLAVAEARTSGRTLLDHRRFDKAIRQPLPAAPAARRNRPPLRQALVWREILGPPVSVRSAGKDD